MSYNLVISGFETKEQVQEFFNWYEGQGEQDFGMWLDCQECEENFMPVDLSKPQEWFGDNFVVHLKIYKNGDE